MEHPCRVIRFQSSPAQPLRDGRFRMGWLPALMAFALIVVPTRFASAQVCGSFWQEISVAVSGDATGALGNYTISTTVPNTAGCDLTMASVIKITFLPDTVADTITAGTLNG